MQTLNITFDLETCALCPTAAVMSIGAVVWNDKAEDTPFALDDGFEKGVSFYRHVDLRSSFLDGFAFDKKTSEWWASQDDKVKKALLDYDDNPLEPIDCVVDDFFCFIQDTKKEVSAKETKLWSQGADFDIAILRNICDKYNMEIPVNYRNFRDHRTFFMEGARLLCDKSGAEFDPERAYLLVDQYEGDGEAHDPIFDCKKSIYSTWQMMKHLRCFGNNNE